LKIVSLYLIWGGGGSTVQYFWYIFFLFININRKQGGGFWSRGQTGTLNNYATDVLTKPTKSSKVQLINYQTIQ